MALSELHIALIALGVAAVAGVFGYNKWQERKFRDRTEELFASDRPDVLLDGGEPAVQRVEPTIGEAESSPSAPDQSEPIGAPDVPEFDERVDCLAKLDLAQAATASVLWRDQEELLDRVQRRLRWFGWNEPQGVWNRLGADADFSCRRLTGLLQLADRTGPIAEEDLAHFHEGLQRLSDRYLGVSEIPGRERILAAAADLDRFSAGVDVQIGVNVISRDPGGFPGTKLRGVAEAAGLSLREDGLFHALDEAGQSAFTMGNLEPAMFTATGMKDLATKGLTFVLDVPRVREGAAVFDRMVAVANRIASALGGSVVDDNRRALDSRSLEVIRGKIGEFQARMLERGIPAGGATAMRLFS